MIMITSPKTNMSPEKGTISVGNTSSNHRFSGNMLVFRGVNSEFIGRNDLTTDLLMERLPTKDEKTPSIPEVKFVFLL